MTAEARRFLGAVLLLLLIIACGKLAYFPLWLTNNDNYITLSTFFSSQEGQEDYVAAARRLYEAQLAQCPMGDVNCAAGAALTMREQPYTRPLTAYFGSWLAEPPALASREAWLAAITRSTAWLVMASGLLVALVACGILVALPRTLATFVAGALALFGVAGYFLPEQTPFGSFQPFLGLTAAGAVSVVVLALVVAWLAGSNRAAAALTRWLPAQRDAITLSWFAATALLVFRAILYAFRPVYFAGRMPGADTGLLVVLLAAAGVAVFLAAVRTASKLAQWRPDATWMSIFLLVGFVSVGENFFQVAFHITPRGHVALLAVPFLLYAALKPNGVALWLLPLLMLYHLSIAGLFYGCMALIEVVAAVRRRRPSIALALSSVLFAVAAWRTGLADYSPIGPPPDESLIDIARRLDFLALFPAVAILGVLAVAARLAWRMADPAGSFMLRAVLLAMLLAITGQVRYAMEAAGVSVNDPAAYNLILMSYYFAPIACGAGVFLVVAGLAAKRDVVGQPFEVDRRVLSALTAAVVALAAARGGNTVGRPLNPLPAIVNGARLSITQAAPIAMDPAVFAAASADDRYRIGARVGDETVTMTVLKMRARAQAGLLDPSRITIVVPPRPVP